MLLARDGHEVTVLERDAAPPPDTPDETWSEWERRGVNQFRMIHLFAPRFRALLEAELPDVITEAEALGAIRYNPMRLVPEEMIGGYRDTDDQYTMVSARRPVMEAALATRGREDSGSRDPTRRRGLRAAHRRRRARTAFRTSSAFAPTRARSCAPTSSSTPPAGVRRCPRC